MKKAIVIITLVAIMSAAPLAFAKSQKPIILRYGNYISMDNPGVITHRQWMRSIEKATDNRVKFQEFHGGSLIGPRTAAKDIKKATADLGAINCPAEADQFPISSKTLAFFYGDQDYIKSLKIYEKVLAEFPAWQKEFDGLKILEYMTPGAFNLVSKVPIRKLEDFKGLQIRTIGPYMGYTLKQLGAQAVAVPPSEVYVSLQKNIVDAVLKGDDALKADNLAEVANYTINLNLQAGSGALLVMNAQSFDRLPADIQKIINDSLPELEQSYLNIWNRYLDEAREVGKQHGHEWIKLPKDDLNTIYGYLDEEAQTTIKTLEEKGLPGKAIYTRVRELIQASN